MKRGRNYWIGFIAVPCIVALLIFLRHTGVIVQDGSFDYAATIGTVILTFINLSLLVRAAKKEAVPAKKSDWIGYAVIFVFLLIIAGVGYAVVRG